MKTFAIISIVLLLINIALIKFYKVEKPIELIITFLFGWILFAARLIEVTYDYLNQKN